MKNQNFTTHYISCVLSLCENNILNKYQVTLIVLNHI